jgi:hypothetical protein
VLVGDKTFRFFEIDSLGKVTLLDEDENRLEGETISGRISHFAVDQQLDSGFYFVLEADSKKDLQENETVRFDTDREENQNLMVLIDRNVSDITPKSLQDSNYKFTIGLI